jgi:hypothetical protein
MTDKVIERINLDFEEEQRPLVIYELFSIESKHVMAESQYNLDNTRLAILKLAQGDLQHVIYFTEKAKIDFRDVILWASQPGTSLRPDILNSSC